MFRMISAIAVVLAVAPPPPKSPPTLGTPLLMAFIGLPDRDISASLARLSPSVRKAVENRLEFRRAYRPGFVIPPSAERDDDDKEMWKARRDLEGGLVALANAPNARNEAVAFVRDLRLSYEWEGEPGGPLSEAEYCARYLLEHPRTRLASAIDLFLLHRYRSAFEAAILQIDLGPLGTAVRREEWDATWERYRAQAAAAYQLVWNRLQAVHDVVIRGVAQDLDEQAYLYQNAGDQHPRRSK
jgi:hypothetical protein